MGQQNREFIIINGVASEKFRGRTLYIRSITPQSHKRNYLALENLLEENDFGIGD